MRPTICAAATGKSVLSIPWKPLGRTGWSSVSNRSRIRLIATRTAVSSSPIEVYAASTRALAKSLAWGSRRLQHFLQSPPVLHDVFQCVPIERCIERLERFAQDASEPARRANDAVIRAWIETLRERSISFRSPNDSTDVDTRCRAPKLYSTAPSAPVAEQPFPAQEMYHLRQVAFGYGERSGDL